jgi:hypothetical protein
MTADLLYDVGMNNGDDTAYYLYKGFRVVAVEADPVLVEAARERFAEPSSSSPRTTTRSSRSIPYRCDRW